MLRYISVNQVDHHQRQIAELEALIADLDGQSGVLIRLRAGLAPVKDSATRQSLELSIQTMITDIAGLRGRLKELSGGDSAELSES